MKKQTFEIPKGCSKVTVEQVGNTIVTTFENDKYIPESGDCVKCVDDISGIFYFVYNGNRNSKGDFISIHDKIKEVNAFVPSLFTSEIINTAIQITPEELQAEFNKLGYEYDFETHTAKKLRWKPKKYEKFYCVNTTADIEVYEWYDSENDYLLYEIGNCYRTPEEAEPRRQHYLSFKD